MAGRFGSGRRRDPLRAKQRVEDCRIVLDIERFFPDGEFIGGFGTVLIGDCSLAYRTHSEPSLSVSLDYVVRIGDDVRNCFEHIFVTPEWAPFEPLGPHFFCPACARHVKKLYLPNAHTRFACRRCSGLTYRSSQVHDDRVDKLQRTPERVAAILSGAEAANETTYMLALKAASRL
jgi:hypothetical protein